MQHYNNGLLEHNEESNLIRTHKQQTTQQVTTVTKVVREVKHLTGDNCNIDGHQQVDYVALDCGPDGQPLDYVPLPIGAYPRSQYMNYNHIESQSQLSGASGPPQGSHNMYDSGVVGGNGGIYQEYEHYPVQYANSGYGIAGNGSMVVTGGGAPQSYLNEYNERSGTPPSERSVSPSQLQLGLPNNLQHQQQHMMPSSVAYLQAPYDEMPDYAPGDEQAAFYGIYGTASVLHQGGNSNNNPQPRIYDHEPINGPVAAIRSRYTTDDDDELQKHMQSQLVMHSHAGIVSGNNGSGSGLDHDDQQRQMRWRDPNLTEVIGFLNNSNSVIVANAAAFLQHLCYMDDPNKQRTRTLGGIPPLVKLLSHEAPDVYRNACGALRNLSYGRQNDENKRAIKNAGGIPSLIQLLRRSTESDVKEIVTSVIWNMSSCEDLKRSIIDDGIIVIVSYIVIPHSGWDSVNSGETCWSTVFRNASGVLRNVSSAGEYARTKLRECVGLVDSLLYVVKSAIEKSNIGNKIVENCVCILRNLSYRCQEVEDPNYDKHPLPSHPNRSQATMRSENLGCFGGSKKKKDAQNQLDLSKDGGAAGGGFDNSSNNNLNGNASGVSGSAATIRVGTMGNNGSNEPVKGAELLWQPEVVQSYLALLQSCSNPETLEAAAGALQNLAACYWQPSIEIRAAVRKEKGLPILVELLRMEVDRVVCAVATALRNLAIDQRNKELIGKYAMRDLVQKLPSGNPQHDQSTSDDTIAAVLATLNEVIKKNAEFSRSLLDAGGVERLMNITRQKQKYTARVLKFGVQVLFTMWQHQELRDVYKKHGWKENDFVTKTVAARNGPSSPNNTNTNTLNRPFESQGRTRYEDRTIKRSSNSSAPATAGANQNNLSIATNQNSILQQPGNRSGNGGNLNLPPIYQRGDEIPIDMATYQQDSMNLGGMQQQQGGQLRYASNQGMAQQGNGPIQAPSISFDLCDGGETNIEQTLGEPIYAQINRIRTNRTKNQQLSSVNSSIAEKNSNKIKLVNTSSFNLTVYQNSEEICKTSSNSWI